jgi:hypothetical protein
MYPLPTALIMSDTSGWGSFKVTYEGCCVINTGALLRVEQTEGRGRYAGAWWEWDCGLREGREVVVGITERENTQGSKEKKERKKRVAVSGKPGRSDGGNSIKATMSIVEETQNEEDFQETQIEDDFDQIQGDQNEDDTRMEDEEFEGDIMTDV